MATSAKCKRSVKAGKVPLREHLERAGKFALAYKYTLWPEDGEWWARCVEMPHCLGDGKSAEAAIASAREAVVVGLAADLANGMPAPLPAREGVRSEQVNIRLSADEREAIEANAIQAGFKGMADYIRAVALGQAWFSDERSIAVECGA